MNDVKIAENNDNKRLLMAILTLQVRQLEANPGTPNLRIELVLADSGLKYQEIAELLGKKPDAVRMLLKRYQG